MKLTIERAALLKALGHVQSVVERRNTIPILSNILLSADRDTLFSDLFRTGVDYSFGNFAEKSGVGPLVSILYGDRLDPFLRYDLDLMVGETPARTSCPRCWTSTARSSRST